MAQPSSSYLKPPTPARKALSFSAASPRALAQWVAQLPKANHTETSRKLYVAVREVNALKTSPADRLELLDKLAISVEEASDGLFRKYLEHPFALNELERKVVSLAQGLATELATGYKAAAQGASEATWGRARKETMARGLHHCLMALLPSLQRCYSLYLPPPAGLWAEVHGLYRLGQKNGSHTESFPWGGQSGSLEQAYKSALLLSIAQPFQLQRHELNVLYLACMAWAPLAQLKPPADASIYLIDPLLDQGPTYRTGRSAVHADCLGLHTGELISRLNGAGDLTPIRGMTPRLQEHLALAWDRAQPRRFRRQPATKPVVLTLGLSAVHSQLCQNLSFTSFLQQYETSDLTRDAADNRFQARDTIEVQRSRDVWEYSFDAGGNNIPTIPANGKKPAVRSPQDEYIEVPKFNTTTIDMSPRGFCLRWLDQIPGALIMGEVVSVKPAQSAHWTIGLLRWLRQSHGNDLQLGVELLSPRAEACAARILNKTGQHSSFLRAIVLPEIAAMAQPESILLPRLKAREGQKIMLYRGGARISYRLVKKITETSAVGQFSLVETRGNDTDASPGPGTDASDDLLWHEF